MDGLHRATGLEQSVRSARTSMRRVLVSVAVLRLLAWVIALVVLLGVLDFLLRLPAWIRWVHLVAGGIALLWAFRKSIRPALAFRPSLTTVAVEIEARRPELRDRIASAIDLSDAIDHTTGMERSLAALSVSRLASIPKTDLVRGMLNRAQITRSTGSFLLAVAILASAALSNPFAAGIAATRTIAPWAGAQWPKRTQVADATGITIHPRGEPVSLRAALLKTHRLPENTDVAVRTRLLQSGEITKTSRQLASWQQRSITVDQASADSGDLFEVLANTDGETLEYRFETIDDATRWTTLSLIERPEILKATAEIRRPAYVIATAPGAEPEVLSFDMGAGRDERASTPASLNGSAVSLLLTLNKPLPLHESDPDWTASTFGVEPDSISVSAPNETTWRIDFELASTTVFRVDLVDGFEITSSETSVFRFPAESDNAPTVVVTAPAYDDTVLPQAVVNINADAQDDVALATLWTSAQRYEPEGTEPSGRSGAIRPASDEITLERASVSAGQRRAEVRTRLDLSTLEARPGDEVHVWATAADVFSFETGLREPTRSTVRRLFVVSEDEFVEDIRTALSGIRRESIRLFEDQRDLAGSTQRDQSDADDIRREQSAITRDIKRQQERARAITEQITSNRLSDETLASLTEDAAQLAQSAADASRRAGEAAQQGETGELDNKESVAAEQERTLDDLGELIALLDSGEDAWSARRDLEKLLEGQRDNLEATRELSQSTAGLAPEDLNDEQRSELDRIADRQQELADQAREATQGLRESQEKLQENDQASASALGDAAQSLERSEASQGMQEAAQQAQENRTARSASLQQEAIEKIEEALERLDNAQRARDEQLRRLAKSLVETIEGLITTQTSELDRIADAARSQTPARGMISLHNRTIAAAEMARGERELRPVARPLDNASGSQLDAITALRAKPLDTDAANGSEIESLAALNEALEEAKKQQEQIEQEATERQRDEIKQAYAKALKAQIELRRVTQEAAPNDEPDRRTRATLRKLAAEQEDLTTLIRDLVTATSELEDAVVFRFAHQRLDEALEGAQHGLQQADAPAAILSQSRAIVMLRNMIDALEEEQEDDQPFDDSASGGGGGGGGQGQEPELIPSGAQLKLLRAIQSDLLQRTRSVDEGQLPREQLGLIGSEQRELSEVSQTLIDELTQDQQAPVLPSDPPAPVEDES